MARILNVEETAEKLRIAPKTARRLLRLGKLPGAKIGRSWRVLESDVELWVSRGGPGSIIGKYVNLPMTSEGLMRGKQEQMREQAKPKRISILGTHPRPGRTVDDFLREKHQETEEEERRREERHKR